MTPRTQWLIERSQPERHDPTVWVAHETASAIEWTTDPNKALWFNSRGAAEAFIDRHSRYPGDFIGHVSEHMWVDAPVGDEGAE